MIDTQLPADPAERLKVFEDALFEIMTGRRKGNADYLMREVQRLRAITQKRHGFTVGHR